MKMILLLLGLLFFLQLNTFGQGTFICEPNSNQFDCYSSIQCSTMVSLGVCGNVEVQYTYRLCNDILSGGVVCTFKIDDLGTLPDACYYEFLGRENDMFDIIMEKILYDMCNSSPCEIQDVCCPHAAGHCGYYSDFYSASCWHWTGIITPEPNDNKLEPCEDRGCCRIQWQICWFENDPAPTYIRLSTLPEIPCTPDPGNGCYVIMCGEL